MKWAKGFASCERGERKREWEREKLRRVGGQKLRHKGGGMQMLQSNVENEENRWFFKVHLFSSSNFIQDIGVKIHTFVLTSTAPPRDPNTKPRRKWDPFRNAQREALAAIFIPVCFTREIKKIFFLRKMKEKRLLDRIKNGPSPLMVCCDFVLFSLISVMITRFLFSLSCVKNGCNLNISFGLSFVSLDRYPVINGINQSRVKRHRICEKEML